MKRTQLVFLSLLGCAAAACSALLQEDAQQCAKTSDCTALGFDGWICGTDGVCIADPESTGGSGGRTSGGQSGAGKSSGGSSSGGNATAGSAGKPSAGAGAGGGGGISGGGGASGGSAGSAGNTSTAGNGGNGGNGGMPEPPCDATACSAANGSCKADVCVIACAAKDCAPHCPAGMPCRVECADDACTGAIDCSKASSCDIECGASSCLGGINCGGASCVVACTGDKSCSNLPIVCRAKSCEIGCPGLQTCKELKCLNTPQTCSIECGGIQSCGTSFETTAVKNSFDCTAPDSCAIAIDPCCKGGATCTGAYKPTCN